MKSKFLILIIGMVFSFSSLVYTQSPGQPTSKPSHKTLPENNTNWSNLDLTYKASPKDSVDWSNLDLTSKPSPPKDTDREWPGEKEGLSGPVIVQGKEKRDLIIVFFDPCGVKVGQMKADDVRKNPQLAIDLFELTHLRGETQLIKRIKDLSWGIEQINDLNKRLQDLNEKIAAKEKDMLTRYGESIFQPLTEWKPETIVIFQQGIPEKYWTQIGETINLILIKRKTKDKFISYFIDLIGVYGIDYVYIRKVQEEKSIVPNDPLYLKSGYRTQSKGGFKIGLGGFSLGKKGGAGLSVGKKKKSAGASDQWALRYVGFTPLINPDSAWNIEDGSEKNVIVAVIDSGLDITHPDGPQYLWTNPNEIPNNGVDDDGNGYIDDIHGWNFINNNNDLTDKKGHGTFVTGIIAAKRDNGIGIAGINPGAQIMVLKVADEKGISNNLNIWRALRYAADQGAKLINISLGEKGISKLEQLGVNYAYSKGALIVVAGGNQADNISLYGPPALRRVFTVGALDIEGTRSVINNKGVNLAIFAPGEDIYSLHSKDAEWLGPSFDKERLYYKQSGTSFSAPIVTGAASLMLANNPKLTNRELVDILLDTNTDIDQPGWDSRTGAGVLNAYLALKTLKELPRDILTLMPTEVVINRERNKVESIDLYGIVRGNLDYYTIELGKGKNPRKWKTATGPSSTPVEYNLLTRIDGKLITGGKYWCIRVTAKDKQGKTKYANILLELK